MTGKLTFASLLPQKISSWSKHYNLSNSAGKITGSIIVMKHPHHFTTILVISLLSFITLGIAASALTKYRGASPNSALFPAIPQLRDWLASGTESDFSTFFTKAKATPALQSFAAAPFELGYTVEQISLFTDQTGTNPPSPFTFVPKTEKISVIGNERNGVVLGNFSGGAVPISGNGTTRQVLRAKLSFPSFPSVEAVIITAEITQTARSLELMINDISRSTITIPQVGEFALSKGTPTRGNTLLILPIIWQKGANGCAFPGVTIPPKSVTVCESSPASLSVAATGNGTLRYQWQKEGVALPGATNSSLTFASVSASDSGTYEVLVADDCGVVRSDNAFLGVNRPGEYSVLDRLIASDAKQNTGMGKVLASSGATFVTSGTTVGGYTQVYVFSLSGDKWVQETILRPSDTTNDGFFVLGQRVVIDNNTIAVSDGASVYIFVRTGSSWIQQTKINFAGITNIMLLGDTLALGLPDTASGGMNEVGSVRIYQRSGQNWNVQTTLTPNDGTANLRFGSQLALSGNTLVVGAPNAGGVGAVYIFERNGAAWGLKNKLAGKQKDDRFGQRIALNDNLLAISSIEEITTGRFGILYLYQNLGSGWTELQKLNINVPAPSGDNIQSILSISQTKLLANTSLFTRTVQGVDPNPKVINVTNIGATTGVLAGETALFGASSYFAGTNLASAGAVLVTSLVPCGDNLAVITSHPQNQQVADQLPAGFRIAFEQSSAITGLQWQVSTDGGKTYTDITGATRADLSIAPDSPLYKNNNRFRVIIISTGGRITSDVATLTIAPTLQSFTTTSSNGLPVAVNLGSNASIVFNNVTQPGVTTIKSIPLSSVTLPGGATPPAGSLAFDVTTTATFTGPVTLTFNVPTVNDPAAFAQLRVYHGEGTPVQFVDKTVLPPDAPAPNYVQRQISARVTTLSPFVIANQVSAGCATPTFAVATNFSAGSRPQSVAVGDFNGDGKPDLAVANVVSSNVSVLLGNGTGSFSTATNFGVGVEPISVAVGDFNGDGKSDLAVTNSNFSSNNVSVLLGNGTGGFSAATNFGAGTFPDSVAVGDFNGDGKPDLAVANGSSNNVSVLLGNGTGGFSAATNFGAGTFPDSVAVGDFNSDGKPDLAIANYTSDNVSVLLGNGTGGFNVATNFGVGTQPQSVAVKDFNGDGKPDLVVANYFSDNVSVLLGNGAGGFSAATNFGAGPLPRSVAVGDFNGDGKPDLAVANAHSNYVSVLPGNGTGGFSAATNFGVGAGPQSVAVGDFNGDGKPDLAVASYDSSNVSVLVNTSCAVSNTAPTIVAAPALTRQQGSTGTVSQIATVNDTETAVGNLAVTATTVPTGITVSNITNTNGTITANVAAAANATVGNNTVVLTVTDGGGLTATANLIINVTPASNTATGTNVTVTSNNTTVTFSNVTTAGNTTITPIAPATAGTLPNGYVLINGSLAFEITTTAVFSGPITLTFNVPGVTDATVFSTLRVLHGEGSPQALVDRTVLAPDTPAPNFATKQISARVTSLSPFVIAALTTPPPTGCAVTQLQQPTNYATADTPSAVAHGDFNGDGKPDLVTANYEANAISVLLNNGTGRFAPAVNYNAGGNPKAVTVGDLNGDNKLDLVVANLTSFDLSVFLGKGDGTFTTAPRVSGMNYPTSTALGDFNNDGKVDLVVANSGSFLTTVMYGNGDGSFAFGFDHFNGEGGMPFAVTTGDFNKDGRADFAVAFNSNGKLGVYLNLPGGFVNNLKMFPAGNQPIAIAAGDFNGDGTDDVAVANYGSNDVTVVTNLPAGGTVTTIAVGSWPETLATTDLNGDKAKDLIVGNAGTNFVSLLTATSGGSFTRQDVVGVESPSAVAATDFNGDGKVDVIVADYWGNRITTYQGACASAFATESDNSRLKTLRVVPSKYDGYPHTRNTEGRRVGTQRSTSR